MMSSPLVLEGTCLLILLLIFYYRNIEESLQSKNQNVNENISSTSGIKLAGQEPKPSIDEETDSQLSTIFGRNVKSEFDMTVMEEDSPLQQSLQTINEDDELHDNTHQMNALQNMAAMFSASSGSVCQKVQPKSVLDSRSSRPFPYKRVVRNRPGPMYEVMSYIFIFLYFIGPRRSVFWVFALGLLQIINNLFSIT